MIDIVISALSSRVVIAVLDNFHFDLSTVSTETSSPGNEGSADDGGAGVAVVTTAGSCAGTGNRDTEESAGGTAESAELDAVEADNEVGWVSCEYG